MDKKRILVDIYLADNLGDDMFLDHLAHSFPTVDFIPFHPSKNYLGFFKKYKNIYQFPYNVLDKVAARFGRSKLTNYSRLSNEFSGLLFLGGGIFREEYYWKELYLYRTEIIEAFRKKGKKVFFIGCNFGPYFSDYFLDAHQSIFEKSTQVKFRDKKSYTLFSSLCNVSYAPDILWSYDLPAQSMKNKTLGISIVDPRHKESNQESYDIYIGAHRSLCEQYLDNDFEIILFSFCEKEGDLKVAQKIAEGMPQIKIRNYTGDIPSYLQEIGSCSNFIAARFHAVIIALKYGIPVLPVIYGDKTENLLRDLNFKEPFIFLNNIEDLMKAPFLEITDCQRDFLRYESKKHFEILF